MSTPFILREATYDDAPAIKAVWQATDLIRPWNDPDSNIQTALNNNNATLFIALTDCSVVGTVICGYDGHGGWIYYMAVLPAFQGNGIGQALLEKAEQWLKAYGTYKIHLMVRKTNADVVSFYERCGFVQSDIMVMGKFFNDFSPYDE